MSKTQSWVQRKAESMITSMVQKATKAVDKMPLGKQCRILQKQIRAYGMPTVRKNILNGVPEEVREFRQKGKLQTDEEAFNYYWNEPECRKVLEMCELNEMHLKLMIKEASGEVS